MSEGDHPSSPPCDRNVSRGQLPFHADAQLNAERAISILNSFQLSRTTVFYTRQNQRLKGLKERRLEHYDCGRITYVMPMKGS
ncbi:MAG: hypothetical protein KAV87_63160, partial [Desulfobacteraceae bacterium]|nr:hypothetical protein [Desulfobacteraceae bacterium]